MTKYTQAENISAFLDGEMSDSEARRFLAEIAEDPAAAAELQRMLKLRELIADAMAPEGAPALRVPVEMQQRWQAAIHEQAGRSATATTTTAVTSSPRVVRPKPNFWRAAVPMAATVLVAAGVLWMFNRTGANNAEAPAAPAAGGAMAALPPAPAQLAMNAEAHNPAAARDSKQGSAAEATRNTAAAPDQENDGTVGAPMATPPPPPPPLSPAPQPAHATAMRPKEPQPAPAPASPKPSATVLPVVPQTTMAPGGVAALPGRIAPSDGDSAAPQHNQPDAAGGQRFSTQGMTAQAPGGPAGPSAPAAPSAPVTPAPAVTTAQTASALPASPTTPPPVASPAPMPPPAMPSPAATAAAAGPVGAGSFGGGGAPAPAAPTVHADLPPPPAGVPETLPAPRPGALAEMKPGAMTVEPDARDDQAAGAPGAASARPAADSAPARAGGMRAPAKPALTPPDAGTALADAGTQGNQDDHGTPAAPAAQAALEGTPNHPNVQQDMDMAPAGGMTAEVTPNHPTGALQKGAAEPAGAADAAPPAALDPNLNIIHIPYNAQNVALIRSWVEKHAGTVRMEAVSAPGEPLAGPAFLGYVKENTPRSAETSRLAISLPAAEIPALQAYATGLQAPAGDTPVARNTDQPAAAPMELQIQSSQNDNNANK